MKTTKEIDQGITYLTKEALKAEPKLRLRIESKIRFCRLCKAYIETNPRPEFIAEQKEQVLKKIKSIENTFEEWKIGRCLSTYKDVYATYLSQMGVPDLKSQLRMLDYLLQ
jgi:hypothetical protein